MSKREKIILGLIPVAVIAAALYLFVFSTQKKTDTVDLAQLNKQLTEFVMTSSAALSAKSAKEREFYLIARAEAPWEQDPFLKTDTPLNTSKKEKIQFPQYTYSGFLGIGWKKLAVINGVEYEQGEELEPGGFVLRRIDPQQVVIGVKGEQQQITVPLAEEVL